MDCEDEAGLAEGALAPLKSPLVNARTGLTTNLGQVLEDVGQHKCLHLVLLRFFGWGLHWIYIVCIAGKAGCILKLIVIANYFEVPDANTLPRWRPLWRRSLKLGQEWWLFLLALLRFVEHQPIWAQYVLIWNNHHADMIFVNNFTRPAFLGTNFTQKVCTSQPCQIYDKLTCVEIG